MCRSIQWMHLLIQNKTYPLSYFNTYIARLCWEQACWILWHRLFRSDDLSVVQLTASKRWVYLYVGRLLEEYHININIMNVWWDEYHLYIICYYPFLSSRHHMNCDDCLENHHTTTTVLRPFFWNHPGEPVPEDNLWTLWCKGRLTEADTPTIRLGATPSGLTIAHLHHPPFFTGRVPFIPPNRQCQSTEGN